MNKLGPIIKLHRQKSGKMQKEYAELLGISKSQIQKIESGKCEPKEGTALRILEVLIPDLSQQLLKAEVELEYTKDN